jgi:hypothetical protein
LEDFDVALTESFLSSEPQEGQKAVELFRLAPQELQKFGSLDIVKWYQRGSNAGSS